MAPAPSVYTRFRETNPALNGATTVSAKGSALIVIDAQNFYLEDGGWPVYNIRETNKRIEDLAEKYRKVSRSVARMQMTCVDDVSAFVGRRRGHLGGAHRRQQVDPGGYQGISRRLYRGTASQGWREVYPQSSGIQVSL